MNDDNDFNNITTPALADPSEQEPRSSLDVLPDHQKKKIMNEIQENLRIGQEMWQTLMEIDRTRNTVSEQEFKRFAPLYKGSIAASGLHIDEYTRLSEEYSERFDFYKPIRVMSDNQPNVLIAEFVPLLKQLDSVSDVNDKSHARFHTDGDDPIAAYSNGAKDALLASVLGKQGFTQESINAEKVEATKAIIDVVTKIKGKPVTKISIDGVSITPDAPDTQELPPETKEETQPSLLDMVELEPDE